MGIAKMTLLLIPIYMATLLPCSLTCAAEPVSVLTSTGTTRTPVPTYRLNYRSAIWGLTCQDLMLLHLKMKRRLLASGTEQEKNYYQGFLVETDNMMSTMACSGPEK